MKKIVLLLLTVTTNALHATIRIVQVSSYQFSPKNMNVFVGDTIRWVWVNGSHTTTCDPANLQSTSLPVGAAIWDAPIKISSTSFDYKVTIAGTYNYGCTPHHIMTASFTAFSEQPLMHVVNVSNFQFAPSSMTVRVGDTVKWMWGGGSHTTTCDPVNQAGTSLPSGAATWDAPIDLSNASFQYRATVEGSYNYVCVPHYPTMQGSFNAQCVAPAIASVTAGKNSLCMNETTTVTANEVSGISPMVTWWTGAGGTGTNLGTGTTLPNCVAGNYYARITALCGAPAEAFITITAAINTWTGSANNNWNNAANWSCSVIPNASDSIIIPATANPPVLSSATVIGNLNLQSVLTLNGKTLTINGTVTGAGTFTGSATSTMIIAGNAGNLKFTAGAAILQLLQLQSGANASVGGELVIAGN